MMYTCDLPMDRNTFVQWITYYCKKNIVTKAYYMAAVPNMFH